LRCGTFAAVATTTPPRDLRAAYTPAALDQATDGLAERSAFFRAFRAYYQWSLRGSYAQRGFLLATGFAAAKLPSLRPVLQPIAMLQAMFIVLSWLGPPLIDVFLCIDGQVRRLIPPWRRKGALLTGTAVLAAVSLTVPAYVTEEPAFLFLALSAWAITFPASAVYRLPAGAPRMVQTTALVAFICCAVGGYMFPDEGLGKASVAVCLIGCVLSARMTVGRIAANPLNWR
jgi:hypothetical protein